MFRISTSQLATMDEQTNCYFLDVQGFKIDEKFVLKELAVVSEHLDKVHHFIFKPPFSWQKLNEEDRIETLLYRSFYHGFTWNSGTIPYSSIPGILNGLLAHEDAVVYVRGWDRMISLETVWSLEGESMGKKSVRVENIENLGYSQITDERTGGYDIPDSWPDSWPDTCGKHPGVRHCAYQKVLVMKDWYKNNIKGKTITK